MPPTSQLVSETAGSIAPASSPTNRLPLHLGFAIDRPGHYAVRWTLNHAMTAARARMTPQNQVILAQSDWLEFDVEPPAPIERERWLTGLLAAPPTDPGRYIGDYLPSLLAALSDSRVHGAVIDGTYARTELVAHCSFYSMNLLPAEAATPLVMTRFNERGPNQQLAYFVSWHAMWFQDRREEIFRGAARALLSGDDDIVEGGLYLLYLPPRLDWPAGSAALAEAERALLAAAPVLMRRNAAVQHALALALGQVRDVTDKPTARQFLQQIVDRHVPASQQASIAIGWLDGKKPDGWTPDTSPAGEAIVKLQSSSSAERKAAAQLLLDIGSRPPPNRGNPAPDLLQLIIRRPLEVNDNSWRDAALLLARLNYPAAGDLAIYLERDGAAPALIEMGEPAVPVVTDILRIGGPARRRIAAGVLGAIGGSSARDALIAARSTETDAAVKAAIEYSLANFGQRPPPGEIR